MHKNIQKQGCLHARVHIALVNHKHYKYLTLTVNSLKALHLVVLGVVLCKLTPKHPHFSAFIFKIWTLLDGKSLFNVYLFHLHYWEWKFHVPPEMYDNTYSTVCAFYAPHPVPVGCVCNGPVYTLYTVHVLYMMHMYVYMYSIHMYIVTRGNMQVKKGLRGQRETSLVWLEVLSTSTMYMYTCIYTCTRTCTCTCVHVHACVHTCTCTCTCTWMLVDLKV